MEEVVAFLRRRCAEVGEESERMKRGQRRAKEKKRGERRKL